ncbi:MAG: LamG domain-containing protein [Candidatus Micrarchaeota archaeon]|nr:LamG domain-containing protein [Candidatus Micrarchaeota archaeon]
MRETRAQSAMEYLMTYGWAILIIAVVLAVLFTLGVFNAGTYGGRAHAGSCTVQRPYGPNTTQLVSLSGVCNGQLPQFVGSFLTNRNISISSLSGLGTGQVTFTAWVNVETGAASGERLLSVGETSGTGFFVVVPSGSSTVRFWVNTAAGVNDADASFPGYGRWMFVSGTYNGASIVAYENGTAGTPTSVSSTMNTPTSGTSIGSNNAGLYFCNCLISNIQIYNTALTANDIKAIYLEGIGGSPINLQNLVGWWPLNGDAVDYSGNGDNGAISNVIWTSQWTNGYVQP